MRNNLFLGAALVALMIPGAAFAQSTGSADADAEIVVTGSRVKGIGGVEIPDSPKNKVALNQTYIATQTPGQSVNELINQLPGVSFQNNDPFGSAGGTLTIRGFDGSRISQTFDGIPLNDTGNYAIYSNQQLDPELIEQVNVNLGSTDVDSPTAAASGSTVNYRTIVPTDEIGARMVGSIGDYNFFRVFGLLNTGVFTPFGTKAWIAGSSATNNVVFNDFGKIEKQQYNARVYQPIGSNGDFISIAGNYNENRNNFFGSAPLRQDRNVLSQVTTGAFSPLNPGLVVGAVRTPGTGTTNRFPDGRDELPYTVPRCQVDVAQAGVVDVTNTCGTTFDERYNPSNTGNIRINSKFSFGDKVTLYIDPSYQYVKANGGGTVTAREGGFTQAANASRGQLAITTPLYGFIGGSYYTGVDANGDGDRLDTCSPTNAACPTSGSFQGVTYLAPSQTQTHRYGIIASLKYDFTDDINIRYGYSHDYGRHRQTGELAPLQANGFPTDVFPVNNPLIAANGYALQKRDRLSFAVLDQFFGQFHGEFFDKKVTVEAGLTQKYFKRNLDNYCFTTSATGFLDCFGRGNTVNNATYAAANPYSFNPTTGVVTGYAAPQKRKYRYDKLLPNAGVTFNFDPFQVYASYQKGIQVPGTDNLYNAFYYPQSSDQANPVPETTDNFDAGIRYSSSIYQLSVGPWYTRFQNRLAAAYDPDTQTTVYRNLGRVDKYGVDGDLSIRPIPQVIVNVFGSYLKSEIKDDVILGRCTTNTTINCANVNDPIYAYTAGQRESGAPVFTFGGRVQGELGPLQLGVQAKGTGKRYLNDQNLANLQCTASLVNQICPTAANTKSTFAGTRGFEYQVYPSAAPAYATVDVDARLALDWVGLNKTTYLQFNLQNVFNEFYVGGAAGGSTSAYNVPFVQIGSPRAFILSLNAQF